MMQIETDKGENMTALLICDESACSKLLKMCLNKVMRRVHAE